MSTVAQFTLTDLPTKKELAWKVNLGKQGEIWIPFSCITAYDPATRLITIKTWILKQKCIKYKTK